MNKNVLALSMICLMAFSGSLLASSDGITELTFYIELRDRAQEQSSDEESAWTIKDYVDAFKEISDNHQRVVSANHRDYYKQHAISCAAEDALVEQLKNDPCSHELLHWGNIGEMSDVNYLRLLIAGFMQKNEEYDKSRRLAGEYNQLHNLSSLDKHALHSFDDGLFKSDCFRQVYGGDWENSHHTAADLIAVRQECNKKYEDYTQSLAEYNKHLRSEGMR